MSQHFCPEYVEALEGEQRDRSAALIGKPETICGLPVVQITPYLWDVLVVNHSPYAVGRDRVTCAAIIQFLWIISPQFDLSDAKGKGQFIEAHALTLDYLQASVEISEYLERTFLDCDDGDPSVPYFPLSSSLEFKMASDPFGWDVDRTRKTPLRALYPRLRVVALSKGVPLINKRSDAIALAANQALADGIKDGTITQTDIDRINGFAPKEEHARKE